MTLFRAYLVTVLVGLTSYTLVVGSNHGWDLLAIGLSFYPQIAAMNWPGQFNFDFMTLLSLSGIWVAWRHHFNASGIALGVSTFFGGMLFFAVYLLWASAQSAGDSRVLLLGKARAAR